MQAGPSGATAEDAEVAELSALLNRGAPSRRVDRQARQEAAKAVPPTRFEMQGMSVQAAVEALTTFAHEAGTVVSCCERWCSLGYGPGRRQSAAEAGALAAIVGGMRAHPDAPAVQEKATLAIANICSGTDAMGLGRKVAAAEAGAISAIADAMRAHSEDAAVLSNASAAIGNVVFAADEAGLTRKREAHEAGAIILIVGAMNAFPAEEAVAENGAFALGNLCRALGKVGSAPGGGGSGGSAAASADTTAGTPEAAAAAGSGTTSDAPAAPVAPELAPIDEQLRQKAEGVARKQAAVAAGALTALVRAMNTHAAVPGVMQWGARALSIITYESVPLRNEARKAGAKIQWLMGLSESMDAAENKREIPMSKTGRAPKIPGTGRVGARPAGLTVRA